MKTIQTTVYEFHELSDDAKDKARDWYRQMCAGDSDFAEFIIDEAVEQGQLLGITFKTHTVKLYGGGTREKPCIWWSGFNSQGDGACFEGTWRAADVKADKVAEGWGEDEATTEIKRIANEFAKVVKTYPDSRFKVTHSGRYNHERSVTFDFDAGEIDSTNPVIEKYISADDPFDDRIEMARDRWADDFPNDCLKDAAKDFMRWIYRSLEKEYEYQNSDECVDENIRCNEYTFTEAGNRFG